MARGPTPYREGNGWAVRVRQAGHSAYLSGYPSSAAASKAAARQAVEFENVGKPAHRGPKNTSVAAAFQAYGCERLPFLKGARQDASRMNVYIRAAGQDTIKVQCIPMLEKRSKGNGGSVIHARVELQPHTPSRAIVTSLKTHRAEQVVRTRHTDNLRRRLACTPMGDVAPHQLQCIIDAMGQDGYSAASISLEAAQFKRLFYHAADRWQWTQPAKNPAAKLILPPVDNARDRVLSKKEWIALCEKLDAYPNPHVAPVIALLLETAMRVSEPLLHALWSDVIWDRAVLSLADSKAGRREVPLTPQALELLRVLHERRKGDVMFPLTYEALKKGWSVACEAAGIENVHIHDLRHTATTRFALQFHGNKFVLKVITGHKTDSQLNRYVNIKSDDVVGLMHGRNLNDDGAASLDDAVPASLRSPALVSGPPENVVQGTFRKRRAA